LQALIDFHAVESVRRPPLECALQPPMRKVVVVGTASLRVATKAIDERLILAHCERVTHPAEACSKTLLPVVDEIVTRPALDRSALSDINLHETPRAPAIATPTIAHP
jgi:hypothetical protein